MYPLMLSSKRRTAKTTKSAVHVMTVLTSMENFFSKREREQYCQHYNDPAKNMGAAAPLFPNCFSQHLCHSGYSLLIINCFKCKLHHFSSFFSLKYPNKFDMPDMIQARSGPHCWRYWSPRSAHRRQNPTCRGPRSLQTASSAPPEAGGHIWCGSWYKTEPAPAWFVASGRKFLLCAHFQNAIAPSIRNLGPLWGYANCRSVITLSVTKSMQPIRLWQSFVSFTAVAMWSTSSAKNMGELESYSTRRD